MSFIGDLDFKDGRNPRQTVTLVLQRCLEGTGRDSEAFLKGMSIDPMAFFTDINGDWHGRPFIGQHVFKVLQAAGYKGTENDIWYSVTGNTAPYGVKKPKAEPKKRSHRKAAGRS